MESVFDSLSPSLKAALARARDAAQLFEHDSIGTEHFLFGLASEQSDIIGYLLGELGVTRSRLHRQFVPTPEAEAPPADRKLEMTEYAREALTAAIARARQSGYPRVLCGHLLRSLLDLPNCHAVKVLGTFGLDRDEFATRLDTMYSVGSDGVAGVGIALDRISSLAKEEPSWHQPDEFAGGRWDCGRRFIQSARARAESDCRKHTIGTEHLLVAILGEPDWIQAQAPGRLGLAEKSVRLAVRFLCSRQRERLQVRPIWSENAVAAIDWAIAVARRPAYSVAQLEPLRFARKPLKRGSLRPEHVLLGFVAEGTGAAAQIIESFGLPADTLQRKLLADIRFATSRTTRQAADPESLWIWINQQLIRTDQSVPELARRLGLRKHRIRGWIRGESRPSARTCDALAAAFGADRNLVRRLAGRPELPVARYDAPIDPARIDALRVQFDRVRWDDDRINRMAALLDLMIAADAHRAESDA